MDTSHNSHPFGSRNQLSSSHITTSLIVLFWLIALAAFGQSAKSRFAGTEFSINGFRNPSIGVEYRRNQFSLHAGYYATILPTGINETGGEKDETNGFFRTGLTYWMLPFGKREGTPSSGYVSASWVIHTHETPAFSQGAILETGARIFIWKGLNARLGVAALFRSGKTYINPTPGLSWSFN